MSYQVSGFKNKSYGTQQTTKPGVKKRTNYNIKNVSPWLDVTPVKSVVPDKYSSPEDFSFQIWKNSTTPLMNNLAGMINMPVAMPTLPNFQKLPQDAQQRQISTQKVISDMFPNLNITKSAYTSPAAFKSSGYYGAPSWENSKFHTVPLSGSVYKKPNFVKSKSLGDVFSDAGFKEAISKYSDALLSKQRLFRKDAKKSISETTAARGLLDSGAHLDQIRKLEEKMGAQADADLRVKIADMAMQQQGFNAAEAGRLTSFGERAGLNDANFANTLRKQMLGEASRRTAFGQGEKLNRIKHGSAEAQRQTDFGERQNRFRHDVNSQESVLKAEYENTRRQQLLGLAGEETTARRVRETERANLALQDFYRKQEHTTRSANMPVSERNRIYDELATRQSLLMSPLTGMQPSINALSDSNYLNQKSLNEEMLAQKQRQDSYLNALGYGMDFLNAGLNSSSGSSGSAYSAARNGILSYLGGQYS